MLKTVLLIMRRASLAQGLMAKVRDAPGIQLCYEPDYANADVAIRTHLAAGVLLEVSEDFIIISLFRQGKRSFQGLGLLIASLCEMPCLQYGAWPHRFTFSAETPSPTEK